MSRNLAIRISNFLNKLENLFPPFFRHGGDPPAGLAWAAMPHSYNDAALSSQSSGTNSKFNLKDLIGDGILWAVPKHRRTVEKRLNRKFGHPDYVWKPLKVKTNLRVCRECGRDHEAGVLCPHCYAKVNAETQELQAKIQEQLGLNPVDKEVVVLYAGENNEETMGALKDKRVVEIPKPRPMWFTKNLLQKSTQQPADTKEVKPSELG